MPTHQLPESQPVSEAIVLLHQISAERAYIKNEIWAAQDAKYRRDEAAKLAADFEHTFGIPLDQHKIDGRRLPFADRRWIARYPARYHKDRRDRIVLELLDARRQLPRRLRRPWKRSLWRHVDSPGHLAWLLAQLDEHDRRRNRRHKGPDATSQGSA